LSASLQLTTAARAEGGGGGGGGELSDGEDQKNKVWSTKLMRNASMTSECKNTKKTPWHHAATLAQQARRIWSHHPRQTAAPAIATKHSKQIEKETGFPWRGDVNQMRQTEG
jgi:hypothetical protein